MRNGQRLNQRSGLNVWRGDRLGMWMRVEEGETGAKAFEWEMSSFSGLKRTWWVTESDTVAD